MSGPDGDRRHLVASVTANLLGIGEGGCEKGGGGCLAVVHCTSGMI